MNAPDAFNVVIRDPNGNVVDAGSDGYEVLSNDFRRFQGLYPSGNLMTGTWTVEVSGDGKFWIDLYAESTLHLAYNGRHTRPAGQTIPFRAALINEGGNPGIIGSASFKLVSMDGTQTQPIDLFDDGQHGDGAAGDGIYGGMIFRDAEGCWMLVAEGTLKDGSPFRRMYPAPIRFRAFEMDNPGATVALAGTTQTVSFSLVNGDAARAGSTKTFDLEVFSDMGWAITDTVPLTVTLAPGEVFNLDVQVQIPPGATSGEIDDVVLVAAPTTDIGLATSATARVTIVGEYELFLPISPRR